jgi:AcrR family transcriptional regulator
MGIRKPKTRAAQTEDNGRKLLDAARAVFVREGYHAATLDKVARAAGLTKGAVYARFDSKAELFLALLAERIATRLADLHELPAPESVEAAADAIFHQWLDRSRDAAWALLVLEFRVAAARDRWLNARYAQLHECVIAALATRIELGARASGSALRRPARALARVGLALSNGFLLERAVADEHTLSEALAIDANRALVAGFEAAASSAPGRARGPRRSPR